MILVKDKVNDLLPFKSCGGHHVCKYCLAKLPEEKGKWKKCPMCKVSIIVAGKSSTRNFALEEFIKNGTFSCPRGCKEVRKGELMQKHIEDECEHR